MHHIYQWQILTNNQLVGIGEGYLGNITSICLRKNWNNQPGGRYDDCMWWCTSHDTTTTATSAGWFCFIFGTKTFCASIMASKSLDKLFLFLVAQCHRCFFWFNFPHMMSSPQKSTCASMASMPKLYSWYWVAAGWFFVHAIAFFQHCWFSLALAVQPGKRQNDNQPVHQPHWGLPCNAGGKLLNDNSPVHWPCWCAIKCWGGHGVFAFYFPHDVQFVIWNCITSIHQKNKITIKLCVNSIEVAVQHTWRGCRFFQFVIQTPLFLILLQYCWFFSGCHVTREIT